MRPKRSVERQGSTEESRMAQRQGLFGTSDGVGSASNAQNDADYAGGLNKVVN